jgi:hypothetical protein
VAARGMRRADFFGWETSSGGGGATVGCGKVAGGCAGTDVCWGGCSIGSTGAVVAAGAAGIANGRAFLRHAIPDTASKNSSGMVNT